MTGQDIHEVKNLLVRIEDHLDTIRTSLLGIEIFVAAFAEHQGVQPKDPVQMLFNILKDVKARMDLQNQPGERRTA